MTVNRGDQSFMASSIRDQDRDVRVQPERTDGEDDLLI